MDIVVLIALDLFPMVSILKTAGTKLGVSERNLSLDAGISASALLKYFQCIQIAFIDVFPPIGTTVPFSPAARTRSAGTDSISGSL